MAIIPQTPSLAELLAAYQNNGIANGINQASTNFNSTARTTADIQAQRAAAAAQQSSLGLQQQGIGIQQQQANTAEQERLSHIVNPADINAAINGQAPAGPVNQTFADTIIKAREAESVRKAQLAQQSFESEENRKNRSAQAALAAQTHQDQITSTASTAANAQLDTAAKNKVSAHSWLPWETANEKTASDVFNHAAQRAGMLPASNAVYRHYSDGHSEVSTDGGNTFKPVTQ
jgi:hypothetical protein